MEWWLVLLVIFGSLIVLLASGLPVAFAFLVINLVGVFVLWGGVAGLPQLILSIYSSVASFTLLPIPLFILMGEVMFYSGVAPRVIATLDKWLGRLPGRLGLLAVAGGTVLSVLTGSTMSSVAMLGSVLVPEMERHGYKKTMSLGPILGSGGLAMMIPPSTLAVVLGAIGEISIGSILIAIIIPGILMAVLFATYIVVRCRLQPSLAPTYEVAASPLREKMVSLVRYVLPLGFIVFMVIGLILMGVATPSEAAAMGALGCFVLAIAYGKLNWKVVKISVGSALQITIMILMIITGAVAFSQLIAFSGASRELAHLAAGLPVSPIFILIAMQLVLLIMGMFMEVITIMMVTLPLFMPVVNSLGFDPVWFGVIYLINMEVAGISPPFGLNLFVMKGVAPADTTMDDVYKAALPFIVLDLIVMILVMAFPLTALWLPGLMR